MFIGKSVVNKTLQTIKKKLLKLILCLLDKKIKNAPTREIVENSNKNQTTH